MGRPVSVRAERRCHPRIRVAHGCPRIAAKLRTGAPVTVLDMSPAGLLVETPVRLLPGHHVDVVLHGGHSQEIRHCLIVHSRVGAIYGGSDLRYRAGLCRVPGSNYPGATNSGSAGKGIPTAVGLRDPHEHAEGRTAPLLEHGT